MPLTDSSKSKVNLPPSSLSSSTAAATESLWSKSSRKFLKRTSSVDSCSSITPELSSSDSKSTKTSRTTHQLALHRVPADRHEFRRKFLEGLQFYCENSSLILNSDLPADLVEFVTSHGFSVEALGIILELKKSSSAFSEYVSKSDTGSSTVLGVRPASDQQGREQNFSEISRRLLQHWMSADSCAEAFVSLSLGEEIPGLIAECASFQRILFAVPDYFHLAGKDFLNYLLAQLLLAVQTLTYGIRTLSSFGGTNNGKDEKPLQIRTQVLASFLDRIFMRYFSDAEHFYGPLDKNGEKHHNKTKEFFANNPFQNFLAKLSSLCAMDAIARRMVSKIFLHLGSHSACKLAKIVFSYPRHGENLSSSVFYPPFEYLENTSHWKFILQTLPVKTVTKSKRFWLNWATYVVKESKKFTEYWKECAKHWMILNKSSLVDENSLYSATLAVVALAREIKNLITSQEVEYQSSMDMWKLESGTVLENIIHSLESMNEGKRGCGMALGQVISDLQVTLMKPSETDELKKLSFDCKSKAFKDIIEFYEQGIKEEEIVQLSNQDELQRTHKVEVLDSDDDEEDQACHQEHLEDEFRVLQGEFQEDNEVPLDPRVLTLRTRKRKIPMYFSEIVETLLESSKDEDEAEILRYIVVLKIPVLLFTGIRIDHKMASTICRCLADIEDGTSLETPIIFALYELFSLHPFEMADIVGHMIFDRKHYALGQRLKNLGRLIKLVQLVSKQSCFSCFKKPLKKHDKELRGIYPEFSKKYVIARQKLRLCKDCQRSSSGEEETSTDVAQASASSVSSSITNANAPLTWRQIVDQRVAAKTRYFVTPKSKTPVTVPDEYSSRLLPIFWSCVANRLTHEAGFYLDNEERVKSGNMHDVFLVNVFQYLARCVLGSSGPNCPHIRNTASHAGELITNFVRHEDAIVRRTVLSLLGVILSVSEGKTFVIEVLALQGNLLKNVQLLIDLEKDAENLKLLNHIQDYLGQSTAIGLISDLK